MSGRPFITSSTRPAQDASTRAPSIAQPFMSVGVLPPRAKTERVGLADIDAMGLAAPFAESGDAGIEGHQVRVRLDVAAAIDVDAALQRERQTHHAWGWYDAAAQCDGVTARGCDA